MAMNTDCEREVDRLKQQQSDFLENADHTLRTPLQSLMGFAGVLDPGLPAADLEHGINSVKRDAAQLVDVWEDLWLRHQLKRGPLMLLPTRVDWEVLLVEQLQSFESFFPGCLAEWEYFGEIPRVYTDPNRLQRILWTLLRNANGCRPNPQQPGLLTMSVFYNPKTHRIGFRVASQGLQIPQGDLAGIFDEYTNVAGGQGLPRTGIGLGLYVARELARQMGGDLGVLSALAGSVQQYRHRFVLSLPAFEGQISYV